MHDAEIRMKVPAETRAELEALAAERGERLSVVVREALREYLAKNRPQTSKAKGREARRK